MAILTEFVDFVFSRNALQWENKLPFLSADELTQVWSSWKSKRAVFFTVEKQSAPRSKKQEGKKDYICRRYNSKEGCPQKEEDCKTMYGTKLRHVCSYVLQNGKKCEKGHMRKDHK